MTGFNSLPFEIQEKIMFLTNFELCIEFNFSYVAKKLYTPKKHSWGKYAKKGSLRVIRWLQRNKIKGCSAFTMDLAAENGHLPVVIWLHENRPEGHTEYAVIHSIKNGHLDVVIFLYHNGMIMMTYCKIFDIAIQYEQFEIIDWLSENVNNV
jgi:hypothetical protein